MREQDDEHRRYMRLALAEAERAARLGEVPVGAVLVLGGEVLGRGANTPILSSDPTAHAEILALRRAAARLGSWRLCDAELFVTMEPCPMCAGAMMNARIGHWVMGGRLAAVGRVIGRYTAESFVAFVDADVQITTGILPAECEALRNRFFKG